MNKLPLGKSVDLVQQELGTELLIYDLKAQKAFYLNETAALIWQKCDGMASFDEVIKLTNLNKDLILLTLDDFQKQGLLSEKIVTGITKNRVSRRKILMSVGTAAMVLPVIASVVAPTLGQVASCIASGLIVSIKGSPAAGGPAQCQLSATNQCCSLSSFNFVSTVNGDGSVDCNVTCGTVIG